MSSDPLSTLSITQLSELLASAGLNRLRTILLENEISGAILSEISSPDELQSIDNRIKSFEAKGWFKEIGNMRSRLSSAKKMSFECPVCYCLYSEVDPTTLACGHTLCVDDAKGLWQCPICNKRISEGFEFAVNYAMRTLAIESLRDGVSGISSAAVSIADSDVSVAEKANDEQSGEPQVQQPTPSTAASVEVEAIAAQEPKKKLKKKKNKKTATGSTVEDSDDVQVNPVDHTVDSAISELNALASKLDTDLSVKNSIVSDAIRSAANALEEIRDEPDAASDSEGEADEAAGEESGAKKASKGKKKKKKGSSKKKRSSGQSAAVATSEADQWISEVKADNMGEPDKDERQNEQLSQWFEQATHHGNVDALQQLKAVVEEQPYNSIAAGFLAIYRNHNERIIERTIGDNKPREAQWFCNLLTRSDLNRNKTALYVVTEWRQQNKLAERSEIVRALTTCINMGFTFANISLASCYISGYGVTANISRAEIILTTVCDKHPLAYYYLGLIYERKVISESIKFWRKGERAGVIPARKMLGMYMGGQEGVDHMRAVVRVKDDSDAMYRLGTLLTDPAEKLHWFIQAGARDHQQAQDEVVKCFNIRQNFGSSNDLPQRLMQSFYELEVSDSWMAFGYVLMASRMEYADACYKMGHLLEVGETVDMDLDEAVRQYNIAIRQDHAKAMIQLGKMYEQGRGVPINRNKAMELYKQARVNGEPSATVLIDELNARSVVTVRK